MIMSKEYNISTISTMTHVNALVYTNKKRIWEATIAAASAFVRRSLLQVLVINKTCENLDYTAIVGLVLIANAEENNQDKIGES